MFTLLLDKSKHYVVGYSTGVDSTALLHYMKAHHYNVRAICCKQLQNNQDHFWENAELAQQVCSQLDIPLTILTIHSESKNGGLEAKARITRYMAIAENLQENEVFLTAHHNDDVVETVFMQMLRGTGLSGLKGMLSTQNLTFELEGKKRSLEIHRPLLHVSKKELRQYAEEYQLKWFEDSSNRDTNLKRNFIRLELLPLIVAKLGSISKQIIKMTNYIQEAEKNLMDLAEIDIHSVQISDYPLSTKWDKQDVKKLSKERISNLIRYFFKKKYNHTLSESEYSELFKRIFSVNSEFNLHNKVKVKINQKEIEFEKIYV